MKCIAVNIMFDRSKAKVKKPLNVIITNPLLCKGCQICMLACSLYHEGECGLSLSRIKVCGDFSRYTFRIYVCIQCEYPVCLYHCPVEAIKVDRNNGVRYIDSDKCIGCLVCTEVCPFNAIMIDARNRRVLKCDLCRGREGGPICTELCPTSALKILGWRPDLFGGERSVWVERKHTKSGFDEREDLEGKDKQIC